jgi:hypothetical protein
VFLSGYVQGVEENIQVCEYHKQRPVQHVDRHIHCSCGVDDRVGVSDVVRLHTHARCLLFAVLEEYHQLQLEPPRTFHPILVMEFRVEIHCVIALLRFNALRDSDMEFHVIPPWNHVKFHTFPPFFNKLLNLPLHASTCVTKQNN